MRAIGVVTLNDGQTIGYDSLIVATGAKNHYFGNDQWAEFAPGLKSIEDATRHPASDSLCVRGGGEGIRSREAARVADLRGGRSRTDRRRTCRARSAKSRTTRLKGDFRSIRPEEARILLLDGSPRVLTPFDPELSTKAELSLIRLGVRTDAEREGGRSRSALAFELQGEHGKQSNRISDGAVGGRCDRRELHEGSRRADGSATRSRRPCDRR